MGATRYRVRNARGEELVCPSLGDLCALYGQGFLDDDDLVRSERAQRWERAGDMPALRGVRERRRDPPRMAWLLAASLAVALVLALVLRLRR